MLGSIYPSSVDPSLFGEREEVDQSDLREGVCGSECGRWSGWEGEQGGEIREAWLKVLSS